MEHCFLPSFFFLLIFCSFLSFIVLVRSVLILVLLAKFLSPFFFFYNAVTKKKKKEKKLQNEISCKIFNKLENFFLLSLYISSFTFSKLFKNLLENHFIFFSFLVNSFFVRRKMCFLIWNQLTRSIFKLIVQWIQTF